MVLGNKSKYFGMMATQTLLGLQEMELIDAYCKNPSIQFRNQLLRLNSRLVCKIARRLNCQRSASVYLEQISPSQDYVFRMFAVLDKSRRIRSELISTLRRQPTDNEITNAMGVFLQECRGIQSVHCNHILLGGETLLDVSDQISRTLKGNLQQQIQPSFNQLGHLSCVASEFAKKQESIIIKYIDASIANICMQDIEGQNSLSHDFVRDLEQKVKAVSENEKVKVIILSGLPSIFSSGADLNTLKKLCNGQIKPIDILLPKLLIDIPVPLISAMEGHATGGGLALGLCADMVILAEESRYGCSFMNMGFTPGMGITKMLEYFMSPAIAHEMLYTGTFKKGKELKGKASFNDILPKSEVLPRATEIAQAIAEKPREALIVLKRYLSLKKKMIFEETFTIESMMHSITFSKSDTLMHVEENYFC